METHLKHLVVVLNNKASSNSRDSISNSFKTMIVALVKKIKGCPSTRKKTDLVYTLPSSNLMLPREMDVTKEKTKWQMFAEAKGLKKRKRSKLVYDEKTDKFYPRYGNNSRRNLDINAAAREDDKTASSLKREKAERIAKNKEQMLANRKRRLL